MEAVEDHKNSIDLNRIVEENVENENIEDEKEGVLSFHKISKDNCIDMLERTVDNKSLAYIRLDCSQKKLFDISILSDYVHLRHVNLSGNALESVEVLNAMPYLLYLDVSANSLAAIPLTQCHFLQVLIANNNRLESAARLPASAANLTHVSLNFNALESLAGAPAMPNLRMLEMRGNKLSEIGELASWKSLAKLEELYIAANDLKSLSGLENCRSLKKIHARDNMISEIETKSFESLKKLTYLNLRNNHIESSETLAPLLKCDRLETLNLLENKIGKIDEYRIEILVKLNQLRALDKTEFTEDEVSAATEIIEEKLEQEAAAAENAQSQVAKEET